VMLLKQGFGQRIEDAVGTYKQGHLHHGFIAKLSEQEEFCTPDTPLSEPLVPMSNRKHTFVFTQVWDVPSSASGT